MAYEYFVIVATDGMLYTLRSRGQLFQLGQISSKHGEQDVLNYKKVVAWSDVIGSGSKRMVLGVI